MFLGGSLDHATRVIVWKNGAPKSEQYRAPIRQACDAVEYETYERFRIGAGNAVWWIYLLMGYDPPVNHLLDTMPHYLRET
jgi:hypothetical protein